MAQNQKKRQQSLERKKAKRKQKKQTQRAVVTPGEAAQIKGAANWPIEEVLLSRDWQKDMEIVQVLVARQSPSGKIAIAVFLVDLGCLGVKNAMYRIFPDWLSYKEQLRDSIIESQPMLKADLNLAAKIVLEAIAYANSLGFNPHRDYGVASALLNGADPDVVDTVIRLGRDGKPFFFAGPYDNSRLILHKLEKAVGLGNFDYVAFTGDPADFDDAFDEFDNDELDDEEDIPMLPESQPKVYSPINPYITKKGQ